jgi:hypothetical protein
VWFITLVPVKLFFTRPAASQPYPGKCPGKKTVLPDKDKE